MPSKLDEIISSIKPESNDNHERLSLAIQVKYNLEYQHNWLNLQFHRISNIGRPILSGLPLRRIYIHPDEQNHILKNELASNMSISSTSHSLDNQSDENDENPITQNQLEPEYEWIIPTHLNEKWSLGHFSNIFDNIDLLPQNRSNKWNSVKRILLAIVQDDGSIVYYFIHDGIVKPRQN